MSNIYKVTSATVSTTKKGYKIFKLQLNNSILASKLAPSRKRDKEYDSLYKIYEENNESLEFLVGKYIAISLYESNYGMNFSYITSYNSIDDFKKLLDESQKKAFSTDIPIYDFLKQRKYKINHDNSITLKKPYEYFNILNKHGVTVCYPNKLKLNVLTIDNIEIIFNNFYKEKYIETNNLDLDCKYKISHISIVKNCRKFHKTKGGVVSDSDTDVLKIGDKLNEDQLIFLSQVKGT